MSFWNRTPKPSEISLLCEIVNKQYEGNRQIIKDLLTVIAEKDLQIRLVLESKFEQRVIAFPAKSRPRIVPEDFQHLSETEMSAESTAQAVEADSKAYRDATIELEKQLAEQFQQIAKEHAEAHEAT